MLPTFGAAGSGEGYASVVRSRSAASRTGDVGRRLLWCRAIVRRGTSPCPTAIALHMPLDTALARRAEADEATGGGGFEGSFGDLENVNGGVDGGEWLAAL